MEARLLSITRCLTRAIEELERVSISEKAVKEVSHDQPVHNFNVQPRPSMVQYCIDLAFHVACM